MRGITSRSRSHAKVSSDNEEDKYEDQVQSEDE